MLQLKSCGTFRTLQSMKKMDPKSHVHDAIRAMSARHVIIRIEEHKSSGPMRMHFQSCKSAVSIDDVVPL